MQYPASVYHVTPSNASPEAEIHFLDSDPSEYEKSKIDPMIAKWDRDFGANHRLNRLPSWMIRRTLDCAGINLSSTAHLMVIELISYAGDNNVADVRFSAIMGSLRRTRKTIQRCLTEIKSAGLVITTRRHRADGTLANYVYDFRPMAALVQAMLDHYRARRNDRNQGTFSAPGAEVVRPVTRGHFGPDNMDSSIVDRQHTPQAIAHAEEAPVLSLDKQEDAHPKAEAITNPLSDAETAAVDALASIGYTAADRVATVRTEGAERVLDVVAYARERVRAGGSPGALARTVFERGGKVPRVGKRVDSKSEGNPPVRQAVPETRSVTRPYTRPPIDPPDLVPAPIDRRSREEVEQMRAALRAGLGGAIRLRRTVPALTT